MLTTIRKSLHLLNRDGLHRWIAILLVALVAAGFEMIGAILVFLVLGLATNSAEQVDLPIVGNVRAIVPNLDDRSFLLWLLLVVALLFTIRGIVQVGAAYLQSRVSNNAGARISSIIVEGYLRSPYTLFLKRDSSELIRNAHQAVIVVVNRIFLPLVGIAVEMLVIIGLLAALVLVAPTTTAVAVALITILGGAVLLFVQPRLHALGRTTHEMNRETLRTLQESFLGIRDVKAMAAETFFSRRYRRFRMRLARASYLGFTMRQIPRTIVETGVVVLILVFLATTSQDAAATTNAVPLVGMFAYAGIRLMPSVQKLLRGFNDIRFSSAPLDDVYADVQAAGELPPTQGDVRPLAFNHAIVLDSVTFRYDEAEENSLSGVSLSIKHGEAVGICGPTGGGKTTLVDILTGFLEPTSGEVSIDGVSLSPNRPNWLQSLGIVPQMGFIIDDTLLHNIALGVPGDQIDLDAVWEAIRLAQLVDYIKSLPEGLNTVVGERGIRMSGGQRQRITIARALYRQPDVLIFDEGTSALDPVTEAQLLASINALRGSHTVIVVAHRLSTVQSSDRIVFLDQGRLCGLGTYDELLETNFDFRSFALPG